jgi:hypothetical protein
LEEIGSLAKLFLDLINQIAAFERYQIPRSVILG